MIRSKILLNKFSERHIGNINLQNMLNITKSSSLDNLLNKTSLTVSNSNFDNIEGLSESKVLEQLEKKIDNNIILKSYIGCGFYNTKLPNCIKKHIIENPKWYSPYTPYQAEISQGRLETQYNYQLLIKSLTGHKLANASLLDEGSSATEALNMMYNYTKNKKKVFYVDDKMHPQIINILKTRANIINIDLEIKDLNNIKFCDDTFGFMFQYPNTYGNINIPLDLLKEAKERNILSSCSADLMSLTKIKSPNEIGCDISFGTAQQFGIPIWYGGPHPSYFSCNSKLIRYLPGRIIGKSKDVLNNDVYRLGLQTREQHIKKDKATSNICTAQALLANVSTMYAIYHGKNGITNIAEDINRKTNMLAYGLKLLNINNENINYFNTILIKDNLIPMICNHLENNKILLRRIDNNTVSITLDETTSVSDCTELLNCFYDVININTNLYFHKFNDEDLINFNIDNSISDKYMRETSFLDEDIFNKYKSETDITRYIYELTSKDYTLCEGMMPLGSCTMKLNSVTELEPLLWDKIKNVHPYLPQKYTKGYNEMIKKLGDHLLNLTGFDDITFQTNSGAMGEYTGLLCIKKYFTERNKNNNVCLIPESAHGTNFASAKLANMKIVKFNDCMSLEEFKDLLEKHKKNLACLMITYPGTNGVFQDNIKDICSLIHDYGGLVYLDGANMNALVGITKPAEIGFDICHLNLHKTFCIPHGGGGPGMGPVLCNNKLKDYLPDTFLNKKDKSIGQITSSEYSSASILSIPYVYINLMGLDGLKKATQVAILNSNYLKEKLKNSYNIIDVDKYGNVAHEFIIDVSEFKKYNITEQDIAKRLIDYSFHPGTMSWPRLGVIMIEPTESESQVELDRLVESLISIREEIQEVIDGKYDTNNNVLKNSPHPIKMIKKWEHPYDMEKAYYPIKSLEKNKFFPSVGRVDDLQGDKNMLITKNII